VAIFRQTAANFATDDIGAENFNSCPPQKKKITPQWGIYSAKRIFETKFSAKKKIF